MLFSPIRRDGLPHTLVAPALGTAVRCEAVFDDLQAELVTRCSASDTPAPTLGTGLPGLRPPVVPGDLGSYGGHRIVRLLGRGGMGAVYEAIDPALDRRVALKLMLPDLAASAAGSERFLREAQTAAAVHHENVVSVYAVGADAGVPFITMELLRGEHLGHHMARGVPVADAVGIAREVALGLAAAHAQGVIHRDIKPANIWIEAPSGRVRLLDFGLARLGDGGAIARGVPSAAPPAAPDLTQLGDFVGTPLYMAPEQVDGGGLNARTDLFALGGVLYQMVTGRVPFRGATVADVTAAVRAGAFDSVFELAPAVPPALAGLIERLLAPDPADRPESAAAVADELLGIGTHLLLSSGSGAVAIPLPAAVAPAPAFDFNAAAPPEPCRRLESRRALFLGVATTLLAGFLAAGAVQVLAKPSRSPGPAVDAPRPLQPVPPRAAPPAFAPLFNGSDLTGWHPAKGSGSDAWEVRGGVIAGTPKGGGDQSLLTDAEYTDFELRLEYRWPKSGGHTVVLLRAADAKDAVSDGLAVNIGDDEGFPAVHGRVIGGLYRTGLVQGVTFNPSAANAPIGQWNELHIVARRQTIDVKVNRVPMPTADLATKGPSTGARAGLHRPAGPVGLVCHWGPIEFRKITIRPLPE